MFNELCNSFLQYVHPGKASPPTGTAPGPPRRGAAPTPPRRGAAALPPKSGAPPVPNPDPVPEATNKKRKLHLKFSKIGC